MRTFFDTSVLVAALVGPHPFHARARHWLDKALGREFVWFVSAHGMAELFAVLTVLPVTPRLTPELVARLVSDNVASRANVVPFTAADYGATIRKMAELGVLGGSIYDGLHARAAEKAKVKRFLTFNPDDFRRVWPEGADRIVVP